MESTDWFKYARCKGKDQRLFFPKDDRNVKNCRAVKAICNRCPIKLKCRAWGMVSDSVGIFGGTTREDRIRVLSFALVTNSSLGEGTDMELQKYSRDDISPLVLQYMTKRQLVD